MIQHGEIWDDAYARSREIQAERGLTYIHPFDDPLLIAGQGGVGLEIAQDVPNVDYVIVPIGGGLISGVSMAIKAAYPNAKVIGVESSGAAATVAALRTGKITIPKGKTAVCVLSGGNLKVEQLRGLKWN